MRANERVGAEWRRQQDRQATQALANEGLILEEENKVQQSRFCLPYKVNTGPLLVYTLTNSKRMKETTIPKSLMGCKTQSRFC